MSAATEELNAGVSGETSQQKGLSETDSSKLIYGLLKVPGDLLQLNGISNFQCVTGSSSKEAALHRTIFSNLVYESDQLYSLGDSLS